MEFIRQYRSQRSTLTAQTFTGSISLTSSLPRSPVQSIALPEQSRQSAPRSYRMGIEVWRFTNCNVSQRSGYFECPLLQLWPVSRRVNWAGNENDPKLIEAIH